MSGYREGTRDYRCSFCRKNQDQVARLIAGPGGVYICNECVALCNEIIAEEERMQTSKDEGAPGTWQVRINHPPEEPPGNE